MVGQVLDIFEIACALVAACSGVVAAWFEYCARSQTDEEREKAKASYGTKWEAIRDSGALQLPEKAIMSALNVKTRLAGWLFRSIDRFVDPRRRGGTWRFLGVLLLPVPGGAAGGWIMYGWIGAIALASAPGVFCLLRIIGEYTSSELPMWLRMPTAGLWAVATLFTAGIWLNIHLGLGITAAAGLMLILLPLYMLLLAIPLGVVAGVGNVSTAWALFKTESWGVFGMAAAVSFFVTLFSLLIGSLVAPEAWLPKTMQMLLCNVVFDGLTMVATFAILARAVGAERKYPIPVAVLLDVVVAALFACVSLWLGLIGTDHALSIKQVLGVLIAQSADDAAGNALGPYFSAMHTTFLPTLGYLALIVLFGVAKLVVLPIASVLKKGPKIDNPHSLMASLFAFVVMVAAVLAGTLHLL